TLQTLCRGERAEFGEAGFRLAPAIRRIPLPPTRWRWRLKPANRQPADRLCHGESAACFQSTGACRQCKRAAWALEWFDRVRRCAGGVDPPEGQRRYRFGI